jgi:hypothetical protein
MSKTAMVDMGEESRQVINKNDARESVTSYIQPINTFPTTVAQGILNPLKKRITTYSLCMNTLFRDPNGSTGCRSGATHLITGLAQQNIGSLQCTDQSSTQACTACTDDQAINFLIPM